MSLDKIEKLLAKAVDLHGTEEGRTCTRQALGLVRKMKGALPEIDAAGWQREVAWKCKNGTWFAFVDQTRLAAFKFGSLGWAYTVDGRGNDESYSSAEAAKQAAMEAIGI